MKIIILQQDKKQIFKNIKHKLKVIPFNVLDDIPLIEPSQIMSSEMFSELADVIEQHSNKKVVDSLQRPADKRPLRLFKIYCKKIGLSPNWSYIESVFKDLVPIIKSLKNYYNRERPTEMSKIMGFDNSKNTFISIRTYYASICCWIVVGKSISRKKK